MRRSLFFLILTLVFAANAVCADSGPSIRIVDDKVSVAAEAVPLSRLLRLLDQATGMKSKVPPELANRNISVRFDNLSFDEAVHKIFEGQPLDYVVIGGSGIIVTGTSQTITAARNSAAPFVAPSQPESFADDGTPFTPTPVAQPVQPLMPGVPNGAQNQPAMIQTPFGAIPNPRANQGMQQQQGISPMVTPGQATNPFNSSLPGFNGNSQLPTLQSSPQFGAPANTQPINSPFSSPLGYPFPNQTQPRPNP